MLTLVRDVCLVKTKIIWAMYLGDTVSTRKNVTEMSMMVRSLKWRSRFWDIISMSSLLLFDMTFLISVFCLARDEINRQLKTIRRTNGMRAYTNMLLTNM